MRRVFFATGASYRLDATAVRAVALSGALIFTTIQAQDFPDVAGDRERGRVTLPIYAPELARRGTLAALVLWSGFLAWFWGTGPVCAAAFVALGAAVGVRFYALRGPAADRTSYVLYNVRCRSLRPPCCSDGVRTDMAHGCAYSAGSPSDWDLESVMMTRFSFVTNAGAARA